MYILHNIEIYCGYGIQTDPSFLYVSGPMKTEHICTSYTHSGNVHFWPLFKINIFCKLCLLSSRFIETIQRFGFDALKVKVSKISKSKQNFVCSYTLFLQAQPHVSMNHFLNS